MKFQNIFTIFFCCFSLSFQAQQDTIKIELSTKDIQKKTKKDDFGNVFYYDEKQKS